MADEVNAPVATEPTKAPEETTRDSASSPTAAAADAPATDATEEVKSGEAAEVAEPSTDATAPTADDEPVSTEPKSDEAAAADKDASVSTANGTPAKRGGKRKSLVPEHKKKTPGKKKGPPELRLGVQPGDYWFVAMRGFPPWPVIICDEEMLPETLLSKRPVSAKRIDGTYREDFREGGKNAKDRRYPIMFLYTNEFAWQVNTDLQPLDIEEIKKEVEADKQGKKGKALWEAYKIAAEGHDLEWFKGMLEDHEKALQADAEEKLAAEAKKQEKKEKGKRKSVATVVESDVEMEDAPEEEEDSPKKAKGSKKRKKDVDSEGESEKPTKTPKTKLKLNNKTPKEASAAKPKKQTTAKKTKAKSESAEAEAAKVEEKPLTPAELQEKREKSVLYLRHRLQKGFLTRDQPPKEEEMANMSDYFKQLEAYTDLEAEVIRKTKVHKVLKAIIKLNSIPKEEEHQFKKRSNDLLNNWKLALTVDAETPTVAEAPPTNGIKGEAKEEVKEDKVEDTASTENPEEKAAESDEAKKDDEGDVIMADSREEETTEKVETAVEAAA